MSVLDKIQATQAIQSIKAIQAQIGDLEISIENLKDDARSEQVKVDSLKDRVSLALEVIKESKAEEQEAFLTLCIQHEGGSITTADLLTYAAARGLDHPEAPPDKESEAEAA